MFISAQLFALSGVPPDRQKLLVKGKTIQVEKLIKTFFNSNFFLSFFSQDESWGDIKLNDGTAIMMMGSADAVPVAPPAPAVSSKRDAMDEDEDDQVCRQLFFSLVFSSKFCLNCSRFWGWRIWATLAT